MKAYRTVAAIERALEPFWPSNSKRLAYTTEYIRRFMEYIGNPQHCSRAIHIAGTSGKTSTAYYTAALLTQTGRRTGLLVSPHVRRITERVQIDLQPLDERLFCREMSIFLDVVRKSNMLLTYAEVLYAFGYWEFARQQVDYMVIEVGMGGLHDATNVMEREDKICILTDIGLDHTHVLGNTLPEITRHKAGIIRLHNPVFCHQQAGTIMEQIKAVCSQKRADLHILSPGSIPGDAKDLPLFLQRNYSLALEAADFVLQRDGYPIPTRFQQAAAAAITIPSRMERLALGSKTVILDGAHNAQKLHALAKSMHALYGERRRCSILLGFMGGSGRNIQEMAAAVAAIKPTRVIVTSITGHTAAVQPGQVGAALTDAGIDAVSIIADQRSAVAELLRSSDDILLITGSLYITGELRPYLGKLPTIAHHIRRNL